MINRHLALKRFQPSLCKRRGFGGSPLGEPVLHYMGTGVERKSARFKNSPRYSIIPFLSIGHKRDAPIVAKVVLMNKSCLSNACEREQLGASSSDRFSNSSLNSSVTKGRFSTGLNFFIDK